MRLPGVGIFLGAILLAANNEIGEAFVQQHSSPAAGVSVVPQQCGLPFEGAADSRRLVASVLFASSDGDDASTTEDAARHQRGKTKDHNQFMQNAVRNAMSLLAAAGIFACAAGTTTMLAPPSAANAIELDLSRGAFVVETSLPPQQSLIKSRVDTTSLAKTVFTNRKELTASWQRIQASIGQELASPAWAEVQREIMSVQGDVQPTVKVLAPADWKQTVKDLKQGRLNFLYNGEIVNVKVEPAFGSTEDNIIIRVQGYKGTEIAKRLAEERAQAEALALAQPKTPFQLDLPKGPIARTISESTEFWDYWDSPLDEKYIFNGEQVSKGTVISLGAAGSVGFMYLFSYGYHMDLQSDADRREKENREKAAIRAAEVREATKRKKEEDRLRAIEEKKRQEEEAAVEAAAIEARQELKVREEQKTKEESERQLTEAATQSRKAFDEVRRQVAAGDDSNDRSGGDDNGGGSGDRKHRFRFWLNK